MKEIKIVRTRNLETNCRVTLEKNIPTFDFINKFFSRIEDLEHGILSNPNEDTDTSGIEGSKQDWLDEVDNVSSYNNNKGTVVHIFSGYTNLIVTIDNNPELVKEFFVALEEQADFRMKPSN